MSAFAELCLGLLVVFILCGCALEWYFDRAPIRDEDEELGDFPIHHRLG